MSKMNNGEKENRNDRKNLVIRIDRLVKRLEKLEEGMKYFERESRLSLDDQLFFGLVFSIGVLLITFPTITDLTLFFEEIMGVSHPLALYLAESLKLMIVLCLFSSGLLRYFGAIQRRGFYKYLSLELLMFCIIFFVWSVVDKYCLYQLRLGKEPIYLLLLRIVIIFIAFVFGVIERRVIEFYVNIGQIKFYPPLVHSAFIFIGLVMLTTQIMFLLPLYKYARENLILRFMLILIQATLLLYVMYIYRKKFLKKKT